VIFHVDDPVSLEPQTDEAKATPADIVEVNPADKVDSAHQAPFSDGIPVFDIDAALAGIKVTTVVTTSVQKKDEKKEKKAKKVKKAKKPASVPETTANSAMDLLSHMGANYQDLIDQGSSRAAASKPVVDTRTQPQSSIEFFQSMSEHTTTSHEDFEVSSGSKESRSTQKDETFPNAGRQTKMALPEVIEEDEECDVGLRPPRFVPPSLTGESKTTNRRIKRVQYAEKEEGTNLAPPSLAPPSLAGDAPQRGKKVRRSKNKAVAKVTDDAKSVAPPSLAGNEMKVRKIRRAKQDPKLNGEQNLAPPSVAPPSLAGDDFRVKRKKKSKNTKPLEGVEEQNSVDNVEEAKTPDIVEAKTPDRLSRRMISKVKSSSKLLSKAKSCSKLNSDKDQRMSKAKSFAKLDCDDNSVDDDGAGLLRAPPKARARKGMLKKAQSAVSVLEKTSKKAMKKAVSSRKLFG
jgi:hypothetical protein